MTHTYYTKDGIKHTFEGTIAQLEADISSKESVAISLTTKTKNDYAALITDAQRIDFIASRFGLK